MNGNRVSDGYRVGKGNLLLSDGRYDYVYDSKGNRIRKVDIYYSDVQTTYGWDFRNRLVSVGRVDEYGNTMDVIYSYDTDNLRTSKTTNGFNEETYTYDEQGNLALVFDGDGNLVSRYLYGMGMDSILSEENVDGLVWALTDHQGSATQVVNEYGSVVEEREFSTFGVGEFVSFRFGYTGREYDAEAGLYYYRNRYYDQQVGKFISSDPIAFDGGDRNLFRYVGNDAVNKIDPSGLQSDSVFQDDWWLIRGIISLGGVALSGIGSGISSLFNGEQRQSLPSSETVPAPNPNVTGAFSEYINKLNAKRIYVNPQDSKGQLLTFPLGNMIGREIEVYKPDSNRFNPNDINIRKLGDVCVDTLKDILKPNGFPLNDGIKLPPYFTISPSESPIWEQLERYRGSVRTNGESGKRKEFYQWDYTHSDIEVYDRNGDHLGSIDPITGEQTKPPVPGRNIRRKL